MTPPTAGASGSAPAPGAPAAKPHAKDTVISVLIALVLAFVFRGFVVEAFQIPTGSMAPTLLGAHMRFTAPRTGYTWTTGPWEYRDQANQVPADLQVRDAVTGTPITVTDPMSGEVIKPGPMPRLSGDRIFVLKYLYSIFEPERFDVVVFKNPRYPQENYIKRLLGLPGEEIALVDGDLFVRPIDAAEAASSDTSENTWTKPGWRVARKPERPQRSVWQPVFDTEYTPAEQKVDGRRWFTSPWRGVGDNWKIDDRREYRFDPPTGGAGPAILTWDEANWPINDRYPYNEVPRVGHTETAGKWQVGQGGIVFPVSDIRVLMAVKPDNAGASITATLKARSHEFLFSVSGAAATVSMRRATDATSASTPTPTPSTTTGDRPWTQLATGALSALLPAGRVTNVEFWHVDQSMQVWVDGKLIVDGHYDWTPIERIQYATGQSTAELFPPDAEPSRLADPRRYLKPSLSIQFDGGGVTIARAALWRDLAWAPAFRAGQAAFGTHPARPRKLTPDHYFVCGDNSPASDDARLWTYVDPWVEEFDPTVGVVPRFLLIGKAFFVYFPALNHERRIPIPDFGRMRFLW